MKILASIFIIFLFATTSWATDLSTATLKQLVTERPDLISDIKVGKDEGSSIVTIIKDAQGRMKTWTEETRNLSNKLTSKRVDKYTYYPAGELNVITQERYKGIFLVNKKKVKHYRNGGQPTVEAIATDGEILK